jgi:hypothetical protein
LPVLRHAVRDLWCNGEVHDGATRAQSSSQRRLARAPFAFCIFLSTVFALLSARMRISLGHSGKICWYVYWYKYFFCNTL